jgi:hypothetical protein
MPSPCTHRSRTFAFLALASVLASSSEALAYRPFNGTDADVAAPGEFELEMGPSYLTGRGIRPTLGLPALVLNQGLGSGWELVVDATNSVTVDPPRGEKSVELTDTDVQLKYVVKRGALQGGTGPSVATEFGPLVPTIGGDHWGGDVNVILSQRVSFLTLHFNGGAALTRQWSYLVLGSLIVEGPEVHRLRPVAELLVEHEIGAETQYSVLAGAIWKASDAIVFDFGARGALIAGSPAEEIRVGFTWTTALWEVAPAMPASSGRMAGLSSGR